MKKTEPDEDDDIGMNGIEFVRADPEEDMWPGWPGKSS